jgi:glycosyltransferase involved in cell wall biosynthesis
LSSRVVTISISCYNYARFLGDAIESALNQDYEHVQVIVVDDGSTDDSLEVARAYGDRILLVAQQNAGQGSVFNATMDHAVGEIIMFLDADDVLQPGIVRRVVEIFETEPDVVKVQFRLAVLNAQGDPTGVVKPPRDGLLGNGDLRLRVMRTRNYAWTPTSANAFSAQTLKTILPMPAERYVTGADAYLAEIVPIFGVVRSISDIGVGYRIHGDNVSISNGGAVTARWARRRLESIGYCRSQVLRFAPIAGLDPRDCMALEDLYDPAAITARLVSLRLDAERHPIKGDKGPRLAWMGLRSLKNLDDVPLKSRAKRAAWFVAVGCTPLAVAERVIRAWTPDGPTHLVK